MNLRLLTIAALLGTACTTYTMDKKYKMPTARELKIRLRNISADTRDLANNTDIVNKLADKELDPLRVVTKIERAIDSYKRLLDREYNGYTTGAKQRIDYYKGSVIEAALEAHPAVLHSLKEMGRYKPSYSGRRLE